MTEHRLLIDEPVEFYLNLISKGPDVLTKEEELIVAEKASVGDKSARKLLIEANLRLVISIVKRYCGKGVPTIDLINEGNIGLIKAIDKFDHTRGFKLSTYASWWISQAITRYIQNTSREIRLPVNLRKTINKILAIQKRLESEGKPSDIEAISKEANISVLKIQKALKANQVLAVDISNKDGLDDFDPSYSHEYASEIHKSQSSALIMDAIKQIPKLEGDLLISRFGLDGYGGQTLDKVAERFNITKEGARKVQIRALDSIRGLVHIKDIRSLMDE